MLQVHRWSSTEVQAKSFVTKDMFRRHIPTTLLVSIYAMSLDFNIFNAVGF